MRFGPVKTSEANGAILAHSLRLSGSVIKKGTILNAGHLAEISDDGIKEVTVARLSPTDVLEDQAAEDLAKCLTGPHIELSRPVAGRVNLIAASDGLVRFSEQAIHAYNRLDETITIATVENNARVRQNNLIATIKIIPFAVPSAVVERGQALLKKAGFTLLPFQPKTVSLIQTTVDGMKPALLKKGAEVVSRRIAPLGLKIIDSQKVPHKTDDLAEALSQCASDITLVLAASATSDRGDVVPTAIEQASATVTRVGMPVDPGNLLVLGGTEKKQIVGLPGCARSPALNGSDWVLERLAAGVPPDSDEIAQMGVGGLLKEIPARTQPRLHDTQAPEELVGVLLAAGQSRRMRGGDKLTEDVGGIPLIRHMAIQALESNLTGLVAVVRKGSDAAKSLDGLNLTLLEIEDADQGMSASLRAGVSSIAKSAQGALVILADLPDLKTADINTILSRYNMASDIVCPIDPNGKRGHPVLFGAHYFENLMNIQGDQGAKSVVIDAAEHVQEVPCTFGVTRDLDSPEAWEKWRDEKI